MTGDVSGGSDSVWVSQALHTCGHFPHPIGTPGEWVYMSMIYGDIPKTLANGWGCGMSDYRAWVQTTLE